MQTAADTAGARQFIYRFEDLRQGFPAVPSARLSTSGSGERGQGAREVIAIGGERVQVALVRTPAGSASEMTSNASEQFHYVLEGELWADIDGQLLRVPPLYALHIPRGVPHRLLTSESTPALTYSVQDAQNAFSIAPLEAGPQRGKPVAKTQNATGRSVAYVYDIGGLDAVPEGALSAKVTPRNYISKKSTSFGAALSGERVHVAVIGKVRATGTKLHTHPNEQFSFVLKGNARYEIEGRSAEAPTGSVTHIPPGTVHGVVAYPEEDVLTFVAKDTSHGMSGPPIDGKEDGPVYWPGFDPRGR